MGKEDHTIVDNEQFKVSFYMRYSLMYLAEWIEGSDYNLSAGEKAKDDVQLASLGRTD